MRSCVVFVLVTLLIVYIVVGGIVFHFLEWENEEIVRADTTLIQANILKEYPCLDEESLKLLITSIVKAYDAGVLHAGPPNSTETVTTSTNWDWYSAIFFATTVVTTIGYGNISPATNGGQIFAVCFAVFGIPLCLIVLGAIGQSLNKLLAAIQRCCCRRNYGEETTTAQKIIRGVFLIALGALLFMLIPAVIFRQQEGWTYWESFYYSFITLTTIGFGDFVAGTGTTDGLDNTGHGVYRLCISGWIMFGLAWMSSVIALYQDSMEQAIDKVDDPSFRRDSRDEDGEKPEIQDFHNLAYIHNNQQPLALSHTEQEQMPSTQL